MTVVIDLNNDSHNQDDEILFSRISNDLVSKGYSANINALPNNLANQLYSHVCAMTNESFEQAAIGRDAEHTQNNFIRSQQQSWISGDCVANLSWIKWAAELQNYLNQHLFLGLFSFESHYAYYAPGDFYQRHYDSFEGQSSRSLSIVVYLNRDWLSKDGGELVLYENNKDLVGLTVIPCFATVVVFLSAEHPHKVLPTHRDRYSIAGWYSPNNKNRPKNSY